MNRQVFGALILFLLLVAPNVFADSFSPSHYCTKPFKPYQFTSEYEVSNFKSEVDSYQSCIEMFIDEQNDAIKKHRNAAEEALDEWNSFVNYELN